jgi:hypothetical protein
VACLFLSKANINTVGVVMTTSGAVLLWYFVSDVLQVNKRDILNGKPVSLTIPDNTPKLRRHLRINIFLARIGVLLTLLGGVLQVVSTYLPDW